MHSNFHQRNPQACDKSHNAEIIKCYKPTTTNMLTLKEMKNKLHQQTGVVFT